MSRRTKNIIGAGALVGLGVSSTFVETDGTFLIFTILIGALIILAE